MSDETRKVKARLAALDTSLNELENLLEPLLSQTLPDTIVGLELLQQAKLQTLLPYVVYDLIFMYLKARGIDPKTHPVVAELERVRQYLEKINSAENPPQRRSELDKDAAERFIKNAIAQSTSKNNAPTSASLTATIPTTSVPAKITTKMIARAQYEHALRQECQEEDEDEDVLDVYDGDDPVAQTKAEDSHHPDRQTHQIIEAGPSTVGTNKRQRSPVDPFLGYIEERMGEEGIRTEANITSIQQIPAFTRNLIPAEAPKSKKLKTKKPPE